MEVPRPTFGRIFFLEVQLNSQKILVKKKTKQKQNSGAHQEGSREEEKRGDIGQ